MKKTIIMICLVGMVALIGCKPEDDQWDVSEDYWEIWGQGAVTNISPVHIKGSTRERTRCTFDNGAIIDMGYIKNPGSVQAGSTGTLYKFTLHGSGDDDDAWFQWVPCEKPVDISSIKKETIQTADKMSGEKVFFAAEDDEVKVVHRYEWQTLMTPPAAYQTVLVKFKNGLCTTAYYTPTGDWKSEMDRKKLSGGIALKAVAKWKTVDLE